MSKRAATFVKFASILSIATSLLVNAPQAAAFSIPSFPACETPQGSVKANYSDGTHGIVGSNDTHTGSDTVYTLSGNAKVLQCFCDKDGNGTQTDWLKVTNPDDQDFLRRSGWNYVPNGALWGLDSDPYMTRNSSYTCGSRGGKILGLGTENNFGQVLGLADTGTLPENALALSALFFFTLGVVLMKKSNNQAK